MAAAKPRKVTARSSRRRAVGSSTRGTGRHYKRSIRFPVGRSSTRIRGFIVVLAVLVVVVASRAFQLQAVDARAFAEQAASQMQSTRELPATRGTITDRFGTVLAETEPAMWVSIDPDMVRTNGADKRYRMSKSKQQEAAAAPKAVAQILARHLGGDVQHYLDLIETPDSNYRSVARHVPAATFTAIQADMQAGMDGDGKRPWYGVFGEPDPIRNYPNSSLAGSVIGFVDGEGRGMAGIEGQYDEQLRGEPGKEVYDRSTYGRIPLGRNVMEPAENGDNYELTLDADLQWMAEQALAQGVENAAASTGKLVALDVNTGEILALANYPSYDPADPGAVDNTGDLGNRSVTEMYEPGSVQKVLTLASLADAGLITPDTHVTVPPRIASGAGYVGDAWSHGTIQLTARGVMAHSSNIGTIEMARQMPKKQQQEYLASFGLGAKPETGLPAEATGSLPEADMADYTRDQISFGQGLSVTAVQMAAGVAAAINGGVYHQPHIIRKVTDDAGSVVDDTTVNSHRVISPEASAMTRDMMEAVITGYDDRSIPGYRTLGKSGTAQRFDPDCSCYSGYTASFVGAAPAEDPQILVYVVLDQPRNGNSGSSLGLPVVNNLLQLALPRYDVEPSDDPAPEPVLDF